MQCTINDLTVHYVEHGAGVPLVALHGSGVDHREIEAAIEAIVPDTGYRRIYPDLPGMGRSTSNGLTCNDDVVTLLGDLIEHLVAEPAMLLGHSYGAYLARGVAAKRPETILGLALLCPVAERSRTRARPTCNLPGRPTHTTNSNRRSGRGSMSTSSCAHRPPLAATATTSYRARRSSTRTALGRVFAGWRVDVGSQAFTAPTLIVAGRRDSVVGYSDATDLLERYPRATLAVIEDAGHALMHERPELLAGCLGDWLDRARPHQT